jgi:hypothetical protein
MPALAARPQNRGARVRRGERRRATDYDAQLKMPIHKGTLVMMGVHLIDNADLDPLAEKCARDGRYEFRPAAAVLERGTASPANPMALF